MKNLNDLLTCKLLQLLYSILGVSVGVGSGRGWLKILARHIDAYIQKLEKWRNECSIFSSRKFMLFQKRFFVWWEISIKEVFAL